MKTSFTLAKLACVAALTLCAIPSLASADRWDRGGRYDRGERYYGRNHDRSSRYDDHHRSRSSFNFSFGFRSGGHFGHDRSFGHVSYGHGYRKYGYRDYSYRPVYVTTRAYRYEPYCAPPAVVYRPAPVYHAPPPVVYYPARTYHYQPRGYCYPSSGVSVSTRFYYRR